MPAEGSGPGRSLDSASRPFVGHDDVETYFNLCSELLCLVDAQGRFVRVNPAWTATLGMDCRQMVGRQFIEWVHPDDIAASQEAFAELLRGRRIEGFENRYRHASGDWRWLAWQAVCGDDKQIYASARDVTGQHTLQRKLGDETNYLEAILAAMPDALFIKDAEGRYTHVNKAFCEHAGMPRDEIIGRRVAELWSTEAATESDRRDKELVARGGAQQYELRLQSTSASGEPRTVAVNKSVVRDAQGRIAGIIGIARDMTDNIVRDRQARQRDRLLAIAAVAARDLMRTRNIEDAITRVLESIRHVSGVDCVYLYRNETDDDGEPIARLLSVTQPPQGGASRRAAELSVFRYRDGFSNWLNHFEAGYAVHGAFNDLPSQERQRLGPLQLKSVVAIPITVEEKLWGFIGCDDCRRQQGWNDAEIATLMTVGNIIGGGYARTLAERRTERALWQAEDAAGQAQRALVQSEESRQIAEEMAEKARAADRAKSAFLANMSHEIRTPMTAILGYIDMLDNPGATPQQRTRFMQTIRESGQQLLSLINGILDLASIEAGELKLALEPCELTPMIEEAANRYRSRATRRGLSLKLQLDPPLPRSIVTHSVRFQQILDIILDNAVKFTREGGVTMTVACQRTDDEAELRIRVEDTGVGIEPDVLKRLFKPFSRGDESMTVAHGGTGLGLVIARHVADALGIQLDVNSRPGVGTSVTLAMPMGHPREWDWVEQQQQPQTPGGHGGMAEPPAEGYRVLVAEDDPAVQRLLSLILSRAGMHAETAGNGRDACAAIMNARQQGKPFHVVLMDMQMPEMDGYEATSLLRRTGHDMPIVAVTAHAMTGDRERCVDAGCTDYLSKPIHREQLLDKIYSVLQSVI